ncbi:MAG: helix-turn-helix transcriptional regulator [Polyangiaceae bacterium]|nr:helix-turn-helix transcriptional regulator [Polyangiaceae bacterium]
MVLVSRRTKLVFEWTPRSGVAPGLLGVSLRLRSEQTIERGIATGRCWIFVAVTHEEGLTEARAGDRWIPLESRRVFLIPPSSYLRLRLTEVRLDAMGILGRCRLSPALTACPVAAALDRAAPVPRDLGGIEASLRFGLRLDPDAGVHPLARKARAHLQNVRFSPRPVHDVARALRVSPETVTRIFSAAYGMSPKAYAHRLRVSDAVVALLAGQDVLSAGLDAGFGHASRFYEIFRRITGATPGAYATLAGQKSRGRARGVRAR